VIFLNAQQYVDIYTKTPHRVRASLGFGFAGPNEVFVRYSQAEYTSERADAGGLGTAHLFIDLSKYRDRTIEFGLRHYMSTTGVRKFISIAIGSKRLKAITGTLTAGTTPLGEVAMYDAGSRRTYALEFGAIFQKKHVGVFIEGGVQITSGLLRNDTDLAGFGLADVNNTGGRFYMPAHVGFIFRL
jgi:hypothetical protein